MARPIRQHIVVVGSGLAGYGVLRELRRLAPDCELTLIASDDGHFYSKPSLSSALGKAKGPDGLVTTPAGKMAAQLKFQLRAGRLVEAIDPAGKVLLTTGGPLPYDALVLALGAEPIRPAIDGDAVGRALSINHLDDYKQFRSQLRPGARVLIMGAGLVGAEFSNDLAISGYKPITVDMQPHPLAQLVPAEIGVLLRDALAKEGVVWHLGRTVLSINAAGAASRVTLDDGTRIEADTIISAVGLRPRIQLAVEAGLEVNRGIKVDATGRASDPFIYAIGDCAEYLTGPAAYVMPIMAAARAIAPSALGTPTKIRFPPLSVQVKTTTCPIVLLPVTPGSSGTWVKAGGNAEGMRFLFQTPAGRVLGYVLTGPYCAERVEMDRSLTTTNDERDAA
jgi:rubredoxin-NAD+ reductase